MGVCCIHAVPPPEAAQASEAKVSFPSWPGPQGAGGREQHRPGFGGFLWAPRPSPPPAWHTGQGPSGPPVLTEPECARSPRVAVLSPRGPGLAGPPPQAGSRLHSPISGLWAGGLAASWGRPSPQSAHFGGGDLAPPSVPGHSFPFEKLKSVHKSNLNVNKSVVWDFPAGQEAVWELKGSSCTCRESGPLRAAWVSQRPPYRPLSPTPSPRPAPQTRPCPGPLPCPHPPRGGLQHTVWKWAPPGPVPLPVPEKVLLCA